MQEQVEELTVLLGFEVNEISLTIAQHLVLGYTASDLADILGLEEAEITELTSEEEFKKLRTHLAFLKAQSSIGVETDWDDIESIALRNVKTSIEFNGDADLNIKIASLANKATRKTKRNNGAMVGQGGAIVQLTLTQRFVTATQIINQDMPEGLHRGAITVEHEQTIESHNNTKLQQPSINQLNGFLQPEAEKDRVKALGAGQSDIPFSMDK